MSTFEPARQVHRQREMWVAVGLTLCTAAYEIWRLRLPYVSYFAYSLWATGAAGLAVHILGVAVIAAVQVAFVWAALASSRAWRTAYFVVFTAVTFLEFGYVKATGALTNARDVEVALENTKYWSAMAGAFADWWAALPAAGLLLAFVVSRPRPAGHLRRAAGVALAMVCVHSAYAVSGYLHRAPDVGMTSGATVPTGSFQAFARSLMMFVWNRAAERFHYHLRDEVGYVASTTPSRHVVLIIDESISAGHLSLDGYPRPTTPWLDDLAARGRLTNWGVAAAATNNSNGSVLSILTGVARLPDYERKSMTSPTLFQYARAMNYRTHLFDGEASQRRFGLSWDDLRFVDDFRSADAFGDDPDTDFRIARVVGELLRSSSGQFIIVLKRGNHFPHKRNYPAGAGEWLPSADASVPTGADAVALTNTYDNAIRYNLDGFFRALLRADGSLPGTTVLYTSDHGEVLSGEGSEPLSRNLAWGIAAVPLFMVGDQRPAVDTGYHAGHHNIFATLLDLMAVPEASRTGSPARSLLTARATDRDARIVLGGFLFDRVGVELRDLDAFARPQVLGRWR